MAIFYEISSIFIYFLTGVFDVFFLAISYFFSNSLDSLVSPIAFSLFVNFSLSVSI